MKTHVSSIRFLLILMMSIALPLAAQSPNTATLLVNVVDETGAVVNGAEVTVVNSATGAVRNTTTGRDGAATIAALPLTGTYTVVVAKGGFATENRDNIVLRSGETATLRVKMQ